MERRVAPRRRQALATAVLGGIAAVSAAIVTTSGEGFEECAVVRHWLAQLEREVPMDAAQAWDDIYLLQDAIALRLALRAELRERGCD